MSARESLIKAYAYHSLTPDRAGDEDLGSSKIDHFISSSNKKPNVRLKTTKQISISSSNLISNALEAGKIIAAAEGKYPHTKAYSRLYYAVRAFKGDPEIMQQFFTKSLLKNPTVHITDIDKSKNMVFYLAHGKLPPHDVIEEHAAIYQIINKTIDSLERGLCRRVSLMLNKLTQG